MSREIKFRVWDKVAKAMHVCETNSHDTFFFDPDTGDFTYYNLQNGETSNGHSDYILEQYTGSKDKNGKEIYEGDVIKARDWDGDWGIYKIKWKQSHCAFEAFEYRKSGAWNWTLQGFVDIEVIGNIHEPPKDFRPEHLKRMGVSISKGWEDGTK